MQKISPYLWFDGKAEEAAQFYVSIFQNSRIVKVNRLRTDNPETTLVSTTFELEGQTFMALDGGPQFQITPALSFFVNADTTEEVEQLWQKLSAGGFIMMPLDAYPFSEKFGWVQDRFGVSWQINLGSRKQKITPFLMFVGEQHGKAEEAIRFYLTLFDHSSINQIVRFEQGEGEPEGTVKHAVFSLHGQEFMAMESALGHPFTFTEALSLFVSCETQEEIDLLWDKLSEGGQTQACGWLKDRFGVSWQIVPSVLSKLLYESDPAVSSRVTKVALQMKKFDIKTLLQAAQE